MLMNHAEVAMDGPCGIKCVGPSTGRVECSSDFLADVGGLAGAGDADASRALVEEFDRLQKVPIEPIRDAQERSRLAAHDLARVVETIDGGRFAPRTEFRLWSERST